MRTASKATEAGSPPAGPRTTVAPTRSPHDCSWSAAAARKVSAAPSTTCWSSAMSTRASLPVVVVLPVPLTPTTRMIAGWPSRRRARVRSMRGVDEGQQLLAEHGAHARRVAGALDAHPGAQALDQLGGGGDAEVGLQQQGLDVLPVLLGDRVAGQQGEQALAQDALAAGQPGAQPDEAPGRRGRDLEPGGASGRPARGSSAPAGRGCRCRPLEGRGGRAAHRRRGAPAAADEGHPADDDQQEHGQGDQDVGKCVLHGSGLSVGDDGSG